MQMEKPFFNKGIPRIFFRNHHTFKVFTTSRRWDNAILNLNILKLYIFCTMFR